MSNESPIQPAAVFAAAGRTILGTAIAGLGLISLIYADFAITWQPVPEGVPMRTMLAYASGALLALSGATLIINRGAGFGAAAIALFLLSWVLFLHPLRALANTEAWWLASAEALAVAAGAWTIAQPSASRWAALLFGAMTPIFGIAHFLYIPFTASMIPSWIPARTFFAWFTGAGHVAGGVSIITGVVARLGATSLAIMFSSFVVLVHIPRVIADAGNRVEWHLLCTASMLTGAAWLIAAVVWARQGSPTLVHSMIQSSSQVAPASRE